MSGQRFCKNGLISLTHRSKNARPYIKIITKDLSSTNCSVVKPSQQRKLSAHKALEKLHFINLES